MNKFKLFISLAGVLSLSGCLFFGGSKKTVPAMSMETEDEKIERLAMQVAEMVELKRLTETNAKTDTIMASPMPMPTPKVPQRKAIGIEEVYPSSRTIAFASDSAFVSKYELNQFGKLEKNPSSWRLKVYANYDFDEVVIYLKYLETK
jgi:hypothetical protein